jgi:hypothetical protein
VTISTTVAAHKTATCAATNNAQPIPIAQPKPQIVKKNNFGRATPDINKKFVFLETKKIQS